MEKQLNTRIEILLEEERSCLERVEKELAVRKSRVLYLESVIPDSEFTERTLWRDKLPPLPSWPSRQKGKKHAFSVARGGVTNKKKKCDARSRVGSLFTSEATVAMIKEVFPEKSVTISGHARTRSQTASIEISKEIQVLRLIPLGEIVPGSASLATSDPLSIFPDMENISDISLIEVETDCEDEIEHEKAQTSSAVKPEKPPVASGSRLKRSTAPGQSKRT